MNPLFLSALLEWGGKLLDRVIPDEKARQEAQLELLREASKQEHEGSMGQLAINLKEAESPNVFVSGARPFILWVCGISFGYVALVEPLARFVAVVGFGYDGAFPVIDTELTLQVLFGLLGLGTLRTYEKSKGVASK
jgi:hypothetical protein